MMQSPQQTGADARSWYTLTTYNGLIFLLSLSVISIFSCLLVCYDHLAHRLLDEDAIIGQFIVALRAALEQQWGLF